MDEQRVVIIGGGILGLSVAYHLVEAGETDVLVLEKQEFLGAGATAASAGGIRSQFTTGINVQLSLHSIPFYETLSERFGLPFDFIQPGYLFLTHEEERAAAFEEAVRIQNELGADVHLLTGEEVARRHPWLEGEGIRAATWSPRDGYGTPNDALMAFAGAVRKGGAEIRLETGVTGMKRDGSRIVELETEQGPIRPEWVVNCAGPHLAAVGAMAEVEIPALPYRRMLLLTSSMPELPHPVPLTADLDTGFYCRSQTGGLMIGRANKEEPPGINRNVDWDWAMTIVEKGLDLVPSLARVEVEDAWADCYTITPDHHPVLGPAPGVENFFICGGFSGHGFMHAPAAGCILAEWIHDGEPQTIDPHPLRLERFEEGDLVHETNVI